MEEPREPGAQLLHEWRARPGGREVAGRRRVHPLGVVLLCEEPWPGGGRGQQDACPTPSKTQVGGVPAGRRGSERLVGAGLVEVRTQLQEAEVRFHPSTKSQFLLCILIQKTDYNSSLWLL